LDDQLIDQTCSFWGRKIMKRWIMLYVLESEANVIIHLALLEFEATIIFINLKKWKI